MNARRLSPSFGINLLLWPPEVIREPESLFESVRALGYDGVEVPVNPDAPESYRNVATALAATGLRATATARGDVDADLSSSDKQVRKQGVERIARVIEIASGFGAEVLAGPIHCAPGALSQGALTDETVKELSDALSQLTTRAETHGIRLCPEILNRYEARYPNTLAQCTTLFEQMDRPDMSFHYDTYHAHIEEASPSAAIQANANRVGHVHFSESDRGPLGQGQVNWSATVAALKGIDYTGWITAEAFCPTNVALSQGMRIWRPLISSPTAYAESAIQHMRQVWGDLSNG